MIKITEVRIKKVEKQNTLRGIASITIDNSFVVNNIMIIEGASGLFVAMPSKVCPNGEFKDIAHPINTETRELIQKEILSEYKKID